MNNNEIILEIGEDENFYEIGSSEPFTGNASYAWPNGNKYVGEFRNGDYCGQGTLFFGNGNKYVGQFEQDAFNGNGTL